MQLTVRGSEVKTNMTSKERAETLCWQNFSGVERGQVITGWLESQSAGRWRGAKLGAYTLQLLQSLCKGVCTAS